MIFIRFYRVHSHSKCIFILIILLLGVFLLQTSILTRNGRKRDSEIYSNEGFVDIINSRAALMNFICNTKYFPFGKKGNQLNNGLRRFPVSTYWLKNENVAYCPVFKSATTTWRNHLIDLLNQTHVSKKEKQNKKERIQLHQQLLDLGAVNPSTVANLSTSSDSCPWLPVIVCNETGGIPFCPSHDLPMPVPIVSGVRQSAQLSSLVPKVLHQLPDVSASLSKARPFGAAFMLGRNSCSARWAALAVG